MNKEFKYKTSFSSNLEHISNEKLDKYLSDASLAKLKPLIPLDIDLKNNKDIIACVLNIAVAGRTNANGDAISNETAINIAKNFVRKYVDINHKRDIIKGTVVNYGFSKFGSNEIIPEEEAIKSKDPFNISLAFILWTTTLNDRFLQLLEASVDPTSSEYHKISGSWELMFEEYDIAIGTKNIKDSKLVTDAKEKESLEQYLKSNGGSGQKDGQLVYRVIKGDNNNYLVPAGIGLVEHPAAEVKGLEIIKASENNKEIDKANDQSDVLDENIKTSFTKLLELLNEASESVREKILKNIIENFTNSKSSVTNTKENITSQYKVMDKITKIDEITDNNLKECKASVVIDFINDKIKEENDKFLQEREKSKTAEKSLSDTKIELDQVKVSLQSLQEKWNNKEAEEKFTQRMAYFDDTYDLSKDERTAIAGEVKDADDATFDKIKTRYDILLKEKNKEVIAAKKKNNEFPADHTGKDGCSCAKCKGKASKASKTEEDSTELENAVVDEALQNGKQTTAALPNAGSPETSFADKWAEAFKVEDCIEVRKV